MASNFWCSTHYKEWLFPQAEVVRRSNSLDKNYLTLLEITKIRMFYSQYMTHLGKLLSLRQRVIATAVVYWKRFYLQHSFVIFDPTLLAATSIYLASKVEECNIKVEGIVLHMKNIGGLPTNFREYQSSDIIQCEFYLMDGLKSQLMLFHPYTNLQTYLSDSDLDDCRDDAWRLINDSYRTDVHLTYPPHIITLACIYLSAFSKDQETTTSSTKPSALDKVSVWFEQFKIDLKPVGEVLEAMINLYGVTSTTTRGGGGTENDKAFLIEIASILNKIAQHINNTTTNTNATTSTKSTTNNSTTNTSHPSVIVLT